VTSEALAPFRVKPAAPDPGTSASAALHLLDSAK